MTQSRSVTVTDSATRLDKVADEHHEGGIAIYNNGSVTVYIGGSDVTTSNGAPVPAGTWGPGLDIPVDEALYGVVASGSSDVRVLEVGV